MTDKSASVDSTPKDKHLPEGSFEIKSVKNIIHVKLHGVWNIRVDFAYLTELTKHMQNMRGNPWCIIVDMRGWVVPNEHKTSNTKVDLQLDRRNQKAECWIVDEPTQGDFLIHFMTKAGFPHSKVYSDEEAEEWLAEKSFFLGADEHLAKHFPAA